MRPWVTFLYKLQKYFQQKIWCFSCSSRSTKSLIRRTRLYVSLRTNLRNKIVCRIFMKFSIIILYKSLPRYVSIMQTDWVSYFTNGKKRISYFLNTFTDLGENRYRKFRSIMAELTLVSWKLEQSNPYFTYRSKWTFDLFSKFCCRHEWNSDNKIYVWAFSVSWKSTQWKE